MKDCNQSVRGLGGWIECDDTTCVTRVFEYHGEPTGYAWTETKRELCAQPPLHRDSAPPIPTDTTVGLVIAGTIGLALALAARDKRRARKRAEAKARFQGSVKSFDVFDFQDEHEPADPIEPSNPSPSALVLDRKIVEIVRTVGAGLDLPLVLSADYVADLAKCPHVLVAGASGSGKSVALHAMVQGLLARGSADLWIVDPKMVEAAPYRGIARVAFREQAGQLLTDATSEMESRYQTMLTMGVRSWAGRPLVIVVDEYGDLILGSKSAKAIERQLVRLAQMGRAAGIHLILATQRPSADVVTPLIRANIPGRLALKCASASNSRIIRGDARAHSDLNRPGEALWNDRLVRAPFADPYQSE